MYLAMVLGMAEMSSALPAAGGGYTFARRAMGPWGGFATGTAILIEYSIAPAAIATFIGAYVESLNLFGITDGWWVYLAVYAIFIGIHLTGAGEALKAMFIITAIALVGLVVFAVSAVGLFDSSNLTDIAVDTSAVGSSSFLPFGLLGIWAAVPFAIWFFLAVEGVPLAAEEAREPEKNVPRGIIISMLILIVTGATVLSSPPVRSAQTPCPPPEIRSSRRWGTAERQRPSTTSDLPVWSRASSRSCTPTHARHLRSRVPVTCRRTCR